MDSVPDEVLLKICQELGFSAVANLRLVNKRLAAIGAEALVQTVRFHCDDKSLARLKALADHPVFSKRVQTAVFEGNILGNVGCVHAYAAHYELDHHKHEQPLPPRDTASAREKRLYERNLAKFHREIDAKFTRYRTLYLAQQRILASTAYDDTVARSLRRFPRLTKVVLSTVGRCQHVLSARFLAAFSVDCAMPIEQNTQHTKEQLKHLLLPQGRPLAAVTTLEIHVVSPKFFTGAVPGPLLVRAFANLQSIQISFRLELEDRRELDIMTADRCYGVLRHSHLAAALGAATGLRELTVNFDDLGYYGPCVDVQHVLGDHVWPRLARLDLDCMSSTRDAFLATLKRLPALTDLRIAFITLKSGCWTELADEMRKQLKLATFKTDGFLEDPDTMHSMAFIDAELYMDTLEHLTLSEALHTYVTRQYILEDFSYNPLTDDGFVDPDELREEFGPWSSDLDSAMDCSD